MIRCRLVVSALAVSVALALAGVRARRRQQHCHCGRPHGDLDSRGHKFSVRSRITNNGDRAAGGLVTHLNVLSLRPTSTSIPRIGRRIARATFHVPPEARSRSPGGCRR